MKNKKSRLLPFLLPITIALGIFTLLGVIMLPASFVSYGTPTAESAPDIPYGSTPENCVIYLSVTEGKGLLMYLDFENKRVTTHIYEKDCETEIQNSGYEVNYLIEADIDFIGNLNDRLGGIVLEKNGGKYRFSSVALIQEIEENSNIDNLQKITEAFFDKISKLGLSSNDFKFIMNNTKTNLNYPTCYGWIDFLPKLFENYTIN